MTNSNVEHDNPPAARPGQLTCINDDCELGGAVAYGARCPGCGRRNHLVPEMRTPAMVAPPTELYPPGRAVPARLGAGEVLSRTIFGGFWALVSIALFFAGVAGAAHGHAGALLTIPVAALTGLYTRYLFRGGRFRILFW